MERAAARRPHQRRPGRHGALQRRTAVRLQGRRLRQGLRAGRRQRAGRRAAVPPPRRHPAGAGAGRDPGAGAGRARGGVPAGRQVPAAGLGAARRAGPPADAHRRDRLELGPAVRGRARRPAPPGRTRRRLHAGGRRVRLRGRRRERARRPGSARAPGRPLSGGGRGRPRRDAVPAAGVGVGVLPGQAVGGRRARSCTSGAPAPLPGPGRTR